LAQNGVGSGGTTLWVVWGIGGGGARGEAPPARRRSGGGDCDPAPGEEPPALASVGAAPAAEL